MFSEIGVSQAYPVRRSLTLAAFTVEITACAAALLFPLLYPRSLTYVLAKGAVLQPLSDYSAVRTESVHNSAHYRRAMRLPPLVLTTRSLTFGRRPAEEPGAEAVLPPSESAVLGNGGGLRFPIEQAIRPVIPPVPPTRPSPPQSVIMEGNLIHRIDPRYPALAKQLGIEGSVVIRAVISRQGNIERVEVFSGPELLRNAALEAVRQWKYRPYYLNGRTVEVETEITVNFVLRR